MHKFKTEKKKLRTPDIYSYVNLNLLMGNINKILDLKSDLFKPFQKKLKTMQTYSLHIAEDIVHSSSMDEIRKIDSAIKLYTVDIKPKGVTKGDFKYAFCEQAPMDRIVNLALNNTCMLCQKTAEEAKNCQLRKDVESLGFIDGYKAKLQENGCPFRF